MCKMNKSEGRDILLILDGFDELPASVVSDESNLVMGVIGGKCLPLATCLITSRCLLSIAQNISLSIIGILRFLALQMKIKGNLQKLVSSQNLKFKGTS